MAEAGIPVEEGLTYKVIEAPKLVEYFVLPEENVQPAIQALTKRILSKADKSDEILPAGTELRIIQNTEDTRYLILPASPKTLTQAELQTVFGGGDTAVETSTVAVQTGVAVTTGGVAAEVAAIEIQTVATTTTAAAEAEVVAVVGAVIVLI